MSEKKPLTSAELTSRCDPSRFDFKTTDDLPDTVDIIGQERALRSIDFGLGIENNNFNIFVLGDSGTGKETTIKGIIEEKAKKEPVPADWCYVYNFGDPDSPRSLSLPPGKGAELSSGMSELVEQLLRDIPKVLESKDYEKHRDEIIEGQQERTRSIFFRLEQQASNYGLLLKKTVSGLSVVPSKDGKAMTQEEFDALPKKRREELDEGLRVMQEKLSDAIRDARAIEKETKERINNLDREVVQYVLNPLIAELNEGFADFPGVLDYIRLVKEDILENIDDFKPKEDAGLSIGAFKLPRQEPSFERYMVNLLVNNTDTVGAPVVYETNPTYYNLFGRMEYKVQLGAATTDFTLIRAGAVHKANGGYLIVNAVDILRNIFVYDSLKRMIKNREVRMEDVWEQYRLISTTTLKPEPIPVKIKLIILGEPYIYYLLYNLDAEYRKLFKVKADFDSVMERTNENEKKYALYVSSKCKEEGLMPFDASGVAQVVELGSRTAGDREKLTVKFNDIKNIIVEASYWAKSAGAKVVNAEHVERANEERIYRSSKFSDKLRDYITDDILMVATSGKVAGQINGMAVLDPGDYAFGKPSRITARTFMGDSGVVNIEREVKMAGKLHNKALMILTSFIHERFARDFPLSFSASITFEQLYDEVEGDSATCTEVYALFSSLSGLPIDQGFAVTGSMNQMGEVQPIGGVNEKIEGFFEVCKAKGLTGSQGVIIPRRNVRNLMLKKEVRDAVDAGKFKVYPIDTVDEGFEILTGASAGQRGEDGAYPEGSANYLIEKRLLDYAKKFKAFGRPVTDKKHAPEEAKNNNEVVKKD